MVHSLAFIGRTRTATVKLLISLFVVFPSVDSSFFCDVRGVSTAFFVPNARGVGVSSETFEKHSGVRDVTASFKLDDELPKRRFPIDRGVDGNIFIALDPLAAVDAAPRNNIDGV